MRLRTHAIHTRSVTSTTNPKSQQFSVFRAFSFAWAWRKNSKNHLVMKRRRRLSFSVIFGRSDLISFNSDDRNAERASSADQAGSRWIGDENIREKHDFTKFLANSWRIRRESSDNVSSRANGSIVFPFFVLCFFSTSNISPVSVVIAF